jgi:AhpD family alkylhydroperoxidase
MFQCPGRLEGGKGTLQLNTEECLLTFHANSHAVAVELIAGTHAFPVSQFPGPAQFGGIGRFSQFSFAQTVRCEVTVLAHTQTLTAHGVRKTRTCLALLGDVAIGANCRIK